MKNKWMGMNWITQVKRLAIYLRDGLSCCYCGDSIEDGAILTIDHFHARSKHGDNAASNLITCCKKCNSSRGNRSVASFARKVAAYLDHGITAGKILTHINNCRNRVPPISEAKALIAKRGSASKAVKHLSK